MKLRYWKSWFLLRAVREESIPSPLACRWLSSWPHGVFSVGMSVFKSLFYKDVSHMDLILTWLPLLKSYLKIRSHSEVLCIRISTYEFGGGGKDIIQPVTVYLFSKWEVIWLPQEAEWLCNGMQAQSSPQDSADS